MADNDAVARREQEAKRAADEARKGEEQARKARADEARKGTEFARKQSEETLREQENMKPVPSQEEADAIAVGAVDPRKREEVEQPEGPAQRAEEGRPDATFRPFGSEQKDEAGYQTRQSQPQQGKK